MRVSIASGGVKSAIPWSHAPDNKVPLHGAHGSQRDVRVPTRQIDYLGAGNDLQDESRKARVKIRQLGRNNLRGYVAGRRDADCADDARIAPERLALDGKYMLLDILRLETDRFTAFGERVASLLSVEQARAQFGF